MWWLTAFEVEEAGELEVGGGEVARAEAAGEEQAREPPDHRVREEVALQRRQRHPHRRFVRHSDQRLHPLPQLRVRSTARHGDTGSRLTVADHQWLGCVRSRDNLAISKKYLFKNIVKKYFLINNFLKKIK